MIDPREKLVLELLKLGLNKQLSLTIVLYAGSSQCVVNKEYLMEIKIPKEILNKVYQKVVKFYSGEFA